MFVLGYKTVQRHLRLHKDCHCCVKIQYSNTLHMSSMDLSPIRQNFEKNRNRQKFHNSLKENPMFSKIAKFGCEML